MKMKEIKQILEAVLFSASEPVGIKKLLEIVETYSPIKKDELETLLAQMKQEYEQGECTFQLDEIAEGYQLRTKKAFGPYVELLHRNVKKERLSHAASEVLAIIAFKQPVTRAEIDQIRGVDSSGIMSTLLERQLVESVGKLDVPGRPTQFGTTKKFLQHFGLKSLDDLDLPGHQMRESCDVQDCSDEQNGDVQVCEAQDCDGQVCEAQDCDGQDCGTQDCEAQDCDGQNGDEIKSDEQSATSCEMVESLTV
jgi:segregation and condensation protein B